MTGEGLASLQGKQTGNVSQQHGVAYDMLATDLIRRQGPSWLHNSVFPSHRPLLHLSLGSTDSAMEEGTPNRKEQVQTHTRSQGQ